MKQKPDKDFLKEELKQIDQMFDADRRNHRRIDAKTRRRSCFALERIASALEKLAKKK